MLKNKKAKEFIILFIYTLVGLSFIILLYYLPKAIVNNNTKNTETTIQKQNNSLDEKTLDDIKKIETYKKKHQNTYSLFFDSLLSIYLKYKEIDSMYFYTDRLLEKDISLPTLKKITTFYYNIYESSLDNQKYQKYGLKCVKWLKKILEKEESSDIKIKLSMILINSENPMEGISLLKEILTTEPNNIEALYSLGFLSIQSSQYKKAEERFLKVLELDSLHYRSLFYMGYIAQEFYNNKKESQKWFIKAKNTSKNDTIFTNTIDSYIKNQ